MNLPTQQSTVRSAEGVHLDLPLAGPGPRMLAYGIDLMLVSVVVVVVGVTAGLALPAFADLLAGLFDGLDVEDHKAVNQAIVAIVVLMMVATYFGELLYYLFWEIVSGGSSPGKWVAGIRVVRLDGLRVDARSSLIRNAMRALDMLPNAYVVGLTSMVMSSRSQRLGDMAAGTLVVRLDRPGRAPTPEVSDDLQPLPLSRAQMQLLCDEERQLIRGALRRAERVGPTRSEPILKAAAEAMTKRLGLDPAAVDPPLLLLRRLHLTLSRER